MATHGDVGLAEQVASLGVAGRLLQQSLVDLGGLRQAIQVRQNLAELEQWTRIGRIELVRAFENTRCRRQLAPIAQLAAIQQQLLDAAVVAAAALGGRSVWSGNR